MVICIRRRWRNPCHSFLYIQYCTKTVQHIYITLMYKFSINRKCNYYLKCVHLNGYHSLYIPNYTILSAKLKAYIEFTDSEVQYQIFVVPLEAIFPNPIDFNFNPRCPIKSFFSEFAFLEISIKTQRTKSKGKVPLHSHVDYGLE